MIIMEMNTVKRLAADIMKIGTNRVRIKPEKIKDAENAMTRVDIRKLITDGTVYKIPVKGRKKNEKRGRRGPGKRKGKMGIDAKKEWMAKIRSQRKLLKYILEEKALEPKHKRQVYLKIKSGIFRSKAAFLTYLKENEYVDKKYVPKHRDNKPVKKIRKKVKKSEKDSKEEKPSKTEKKGEKK